MTSFELFIFEKWCKCTFKKVILISRKTFFLISFLLASWRSMTKIAGSGSISQRRGSADPDPHQNAMDPEHWLFAPAKASMVGVCPVSVSGTQRRKWERCSRSTAAWLIATVRWAGRRTAGSWWAWPRRRPHAGQNRLSSPAHIRQVCPRFFNENKKFVVVLNKIFSAAYLHVGFPRWLVMEKIYSCLESSEK